MSVGVVGALSLAATVAVAVQPGSLASASTSKSKSPYTVANMVSLTGSSELYGTGEKAGVAFKVKQVNAAGGVAGHKIKVNVFNDNTDPSLGVSQLRSIIANQANLALLGPTSSDVSTAVIGPAQQAGVPVLGPANIPAMTKPVKSYIFRTFIADQIGSRAVLRFLANKGDKRVAIIYPSNAFGEEGGASFKAVARDYGVKIVAYVGYPPSATDMTAEVLQAKAKHPQAYIAWDGSTSLVPVLIDMRNQGIKSSQTPIVTTVQGANPATIKAAGSAVEGVYCQSQLAPSYPHPGPQTTFVKTWQQANGSLPTDADAVGYLQAELLVKGMQNVLKQHRPMTRANLQKGIQAIRNFTTVYGDVTYTAKNHDGLGVNQVQLNVIQKGVVKPVTS